MMRHYAITITPPTIMRSSLEDNPMTYRAVLVINNSPQNSKGSIYRAGTPK